MSVTGRSGAWQRHLHLVPGAVLTLLLGACAGCQPSSSGDADGAAPSSAGPVTGIDDAGRGRGGIDGGGVDGGGLDGGAGDGGSSLGPRDAGSGATADGGGHSFAQDPATGLSADFRAWLTAQGLASRHFERSDLVGGSYGGRLVPGEPLAHTPVVFLHGNSDRALGGPLGGWSRSIEGLLQAGYRPAELYATTWGPADPALASAQTHLGATLVQLRAFIEAVRAYTGQARVSIVAHSMGVTLGRKVVLGGAATDPGGATVQLGTPLTASVEAFVGIAGANRGLASCYATGGFVATCNAVNGFWPGQLIGTQVVGLSSLLVGLGAQTHYEGARVYSIWSTQDSVAGLSNLVWGVLTSPIPGQDGEQRYDTAQWGHLELRDDTVDVQLQFLLGN